MKNAKKRILIVDDHPLVREGLVHLISTQEDLEVCGQAAEAADAMRMLNSTSPEMVIIDIMLKQGSGLELVSQIKAVDENVKMLVSSMHDELLYAERCLNAGAKGYVMKQGDTDELLVAIRRILDGKVYISQNLTERMMLGVAGGTAVSGKPALDKLTNRELQVLELIGQGRTTSEAAEHLHLSIKTIETHRENIKRKLNLNSGPELVRFAIHLFMSEQ